MPKVSGKPIASVNGLDIYIRSQPAKRKGKDRLWIQVRQKEPKKWRIAASLCYVNGFDIRFEK